MLSFKINLDRFLGLNKYRNYIYNLLKVLLKRKIMKSFIIHILEVDVKETDSATGAEQEVVTAKVVASDSTLTGETFQITETDPANFGSYVTGKNYSLTPTLVADSAVPATQTEAEAPESTATAESETTDTASNAAEGSEQPAGDAPQA